MPGKNDYHFGPDGTDDAQETSCGHGIGWLLVEQNEHTTSDKQAFLNDHDRCEDCEKVVPSAASDSIVREHVARARHEDGY